MLDSNNSDETHLIYNKIKNFERFVKFKLVKDKATLFLAALVVG